MVGYARKGFLRLITGRVDTDFLTARNMLTQRTVCPTCSGSVSIDISHLKDGDISGLGLLQKNYGLVAIKVEDNQREIIMVNAGSGKPEIVQTLPVKQAVVYFKAECDFRNRKDIAYFFYSLDNRNWQPIGTALKMSYTLPHFMGYRYALFNYSTKTSGGFADFDFFHIQDQLTEPGK